MLLWNRHALTLVLSLQDLGKRRLQTALELSIGDHQYTLFITGHQGHFLWYTRIQL